MDAFDGYVSYRLLSETELVGEIGEMRAIMERQYEHLDIDQDLGLGMMLWLAHFFPGEDWAKVQRERSLAALDFLWVDPPGYFGRASGARHVRIAFANFGVSIGLQSQDLWSDRVRALNDYFEKYRSGDEYDREAITWVMACCSHFPRAFVSQN
jgi:truncated hemoglobin YjbI